MPNTVDELKEDGRSVCISMIIISMTYSLKVKTSFSFQSSVCICSTITTLESWVTLKYAPMVNKTSKSSIMLTCIFQLLKTHPNIHLRTWLCYWVELERHLVKAVPVVSTSFTAQPVISIIPTGQTGRYLLRLYWNNNYSISTCHNYMWFLLNHLRVRAHKMS